jgi:hypothetical protein
VDEHQKSDVPCDASTPAPVETAGCLALFVRYSWFMIGPIVLLGLAAVLAKGAHVLLEVSYFCVAGTVIVLRYLDWTLFHGQNADGTPDTPEAWRQYALGVIAAAAGLWMLVRFVASRGWV